jgi:hypothetical protein
MVRRAASEGGSARKMKRPPKKAASAAPSPLKAWGEIDPTVGRGGVAQRGDVGIGGGLQESKAAGDHEERAQEKGIGTQRGGGPEEEGTQGEEQQSAHDATAIAEAFHHGAGGQGHHEIGDEEGGIHQGGAHIVELQRAAQVRDQDGIEVVCQGPQEKEASDQQDGEAGVAGFHAQRSWRRRIVKGMVPGSWSLDTSTK